jgi:hypothetical protein
MATIRNPQQVGEELCEDARIGRGAHGMVGHCSSCKQGIENSLPRGRREPPDVAGSARILVGA